MADSKSTLIKGDKRLIDSLHAHIALINEKGEIVETNQAWRDFSPQEIQLARTSVGSNYFEMLQHAIELGNDHALKLFLGIKKVIRGEKKTFTHTYPLQTGSRSLWYEMTFRSNNDECTEFLMLHQDVSASMLSREQMTENESRYRIQFEQSLDGILITDTNGTIIDANPAACKILGWDCEELKTKRRSQIVNISDPAYQKALRKRKETGTYQLETELIHKNGNNIPVEITSRAYRNKSGKLRAIVNFRDISRRKEAEQNLIKNNNFTDSALNSIPGVFLVLDTEGNLVRWNDHMITELGYTEEELSNTNAMEFITDSEKAKVQDRMQQCFQNGELAIETTVYSKKGGTKDYYLYAKRFEEDGQLFLVGAGIDITESKKIERENRKHQLMLQQLFDNAPVGIAISDTENKVRQVNKSFEQIFGYSRSEALDRNINELIVPEGKMEEARSLSEHSKNGKSIQAKTIRINQSKQEVPVLVGSVPVELQDEIIAIYGIYVDISEQHAYQKQIEKTLKEKETLLAELHHRVKNNLALISSMLELQLFDTGNRQLSAELRNIKGRIMTIASVHELLYKNGNLTNIPFNDFLDEIIPGKTNLEEMDADNIAFKIDAEDTLLDINQSIPCGLLLNELLTLLYGYLDNESEKSIHVRLRDYNGSIHLIVEGEKMLREVEALKSGKSLHNVLIETLLMQLDALMLWPNPGSDYQKFEIIFGRRNGNSPARALLNNPS